jgi:hypothetical protein
MHTAQQQQQQQRRTPRSSTSALRYPSTQSMWRRFVLIVTVVGVGNILLSSSSSSLENGGGIALPLLPLLQLPMIEAQPTTTATTTAWSGCINPKLTTKQNWIRAQQPTRVFLSIANTTNWSAGAAYTRASFEPLADVYSRFHIPNCTFSYLLIYLLIYLFTHTCAFS